MAAPVEALRRLSLRTPLRTKLITAVLALVIMALAAISVASVYMLQSYVATQHDSSLENQFASLTPNEISRVVTIGHGGTFAGTMVLGLQEPGKQLSWQQYINPGGGTYTPTGALPALPTATNWAGGNGASPVILTTPSQSGTDSWRVVATTTTDDGQPATLLLATDLGDVGALTNRLIAFDLIVGAAIVVVLVTAGIAVVQTNLRPLNDIEMTAGQIAKGHLDHRVPESDPRTEIGSLGRSLNAMLTQIESAFHDREASEQAAHQSEERMRRFIADASHELRTPLTTIRGFAAHYRQRGGAEGVRLPAAAAPGASFRTGGGASGDSAYPGDADGLTPEELDHLMGRVEAEATRMGLLVEDLLTLARLDQQRPLAKAPVDLLTVAADAVQDARIVAPGRPIDLVVAPGKAFIVDGDEPRLRQVLANLVNNALTHTPDGTAVRVKIAPGTVQAGLVPEPGRAAAAGELSADGGPGGPRETAGPGEISVPGNSGAPSEASQPAEVVPSWADGTGPLPAPAGGAAPEAVPAVMLDVEDDGPGMTSDQAQRVFERFYRADAARNRASGGTGLGLAIVAGIVAAHGGTVSVRTAPGHGADFQVKLPLSPDVLAADDEPDEPPA